MNLDEKKQILKIMIEHGNAEFINALYNKAIALNLITKKKSR